MVTLNDSVFEKIFPFFIRIDADMKIISSGASIRKVVGNVDGRYFSDVFKFVRPSMSIRYEFNSLKDHQDIIIILESVEFPLKTRFRGQFIYFQDKDEIVYLNSPWITDVHDLSFHNLLISDFAVHDTITDNLQLLQSKEIMFEDMKKIADELIIQRNELIDKNETIIELARFPDQNPQPIMRMDFEGRVLYANDPASALIVDKKLLDLPFWGTVYLRFEANGYINYEKEFTLDNQIFHATFVPIKEKRYFNIYLRDITKTIEFQHELMNTSSRLHTLIRSMHSAVLAEDTNREIILVNQIFCDLFEIPLDPETMKGMDCSLAAQNAKALFENEEGFVKRIDELLLEKKSVYGDLLKMKNGKVLERDFLPIYEEGEYIGHIWKYQDITELMYSKESLRKVEDKYRKIIENLELGLIEVDLDEKITKVYPAFCQMTGYEQDELLGMNARTLLAFEEDRMLLDEQNLLREQGLSSVYETRIRTKKGDVKYVIISGAPILDANNKIVGSLGVHVDITVRKQLEEDLLEANKKALSSVKLKEMFVANMSHEIRTPMNVIIGMMDLIDEKGLNEEQKRYFLTIRKSADALLELINDLLDYSKIEAGQLTLEQTNVNLYDMFEHLQYSFAERARSKGVELMSSLDSRIHSQLISDGSKLNQVFVNLISNAVKFTESGYVKFSGELVSEDGEKQRIKFSVLDTGVGIAPENIESIFQTFIQEDSSVSRKYGGTGLGLSISREIVAKFGGMIEVHSEKDKGSEFSFVIDLLKGAVKKTPEAEFRSDQIDFKKVHILVAEDNPMNQTLIRSIFMQSGISFDLAENGKEVLGLLQKGRYDLLLIDIQMPVMDGITATKHIRNDLKMDIPIVALTANASAEDERLYRSIGMDDYLAKPFKKDDLFRLISRTVSKGLSKHEKVSEVKIESIANYSLDELEEIGGGDKEFVKSILETFISNTPQYLDQIRNGILKGDLESARKAAHQLKPSFDILLIRDASRDIRILEDELKKGVPDKEKLERVYLEIEKTIKAVIDDLISKS